MNKDGLSLSVIEDILNEQEDDEKYPRVEQHGPLRWFDKGMRCASRNCGSHTFLKLQNIPYCEKHSLRKMNEMLYQSGVEK